MRVIGPLYAESLKYGQYEYSFKHNVSRILVYLLIMETMVVMKVQSHKLLHYHIYHTHTPFML